MKIRVETWGEYNYLRYQRGIDALYDSRCELAHALRVEIQKEKFGGNNAEGNQKFYEYCLYHMPHFCENCGKRIPHASAINVSHILTRGSHPEMAFDCRNVNILCAECHNLWEHTTTRAKLRLWFVEKNNRTIQELKQEYNNGNDA